MSPLVMGVLNHGGPFDPPKATITRGLEMITDGADIIDVGGDLPAVADVVAALAEQVRVSIHTTDATVARAAFEAGATVVNDMSADLWPIAAEAGAGWIAVHGPCAVDDPEVVATVRRALVERATAALEGGVDEVWIDPGVGFGKSLAQSVQLLGHIDDLVATGLPVAIATSRKRFIGALLAASDARSTEPSLPGLAPPPIIDLAADDVMVASDDRIEGSLATAVHALVHGVSLVRVHDVRATAHAVRLLTAEVAA
ncbi:MAG TPA: dihydropteroate synthase [Acidimicrobiales bacterium]|nr:dihydropteroate synthase [Acidimicrobiales bacterium]